MAEAERPSLVILRSHIGYPSPKYTDTAYAHGNALGADEVAATKAILGLPPEDFFVPDDVLEYYRAAGVRGRRRARGVGAAARRRTGPRSPSSRRSSTRASSGRGLPGWESKLPSWEAGGKAVATRVACKEVLDAIVDVVPPLVAGGADLTGQHRHRARRLPRRRHPRVRRPPDPLGHPRARHGLGDERHGGERPAARGRHVLRVQRLHAPAVRLAALSQYKTAFVWSHDSVGVGEDGPTHEPIEHLASLRAMPELRLIRPADANETAQAWRVHIDGEGPTALILSRQGLPVLANSAARAPEGLPRGAYVLVDETGDDLDLVLIGTGSEVSVCVTACEQLVAEGYSVRVVSMPSWDLFDAQPDEYCDAVLPPDAMALSVEAGATLGWERYADVAIGIDRFGASAPGSTVLDELGINPDHVVERALEMLELAGDVA